jgi:hypothetical protein
VNADDRVDPISVLHADSPVGKKPVIEVSLHRISKIPKILLIHAQFSLLGKTVRFQDDSVVDRAVAQISKDWRVQGESDWKQRRIAGKKDGCHQGDQHKNKKPPQETVHLVPAAMAAFSFTIPA